MSALPQYQMGDKQERSEERDYMITKFATLSRVTFARRTVIKRWNNPRGVAVHFAK